MRPLALLVFFVCLVAEAKLSHAELNLGGEVATTGTFYPREGVEGRDVQWSLQAQLDLSFRFSRNWRASLEPRIHYDPLDPGRWRWVPKEAKVDFRRGSWRGTLGRDHIVWGAADTFNPTDLLSVRDLGLDFVDGESPGEWLARMAYSRPGWGIEFVFLPALEGAKFPSARSPWSISKAFDRLSGFNFNLPLDDDPRLPPETEEVSFAVRARRSFSGTDVFLVGYSGIDRNPVLTVRFDGLFPNQLRSTYLPLHLIGLETQTVVGGFVLKGAATFRDQSVNDAAFSSSVFGALGLSRHSLQGVVGVEYLFEEVPFGGSLDLGAEFLLEDGSSENAITSYRPFDRDLALYINYLAQDLSDTTIELAWLQDLRRAESVGVFRLTRRIRGSLKVELGGDLILGPDSGSSPYTLFNANDRVLFGLNYGF